MENVIEFRSYNLMPGTRGEFESRFEREALPMLRRWGVDVVAYGPSLHDDDSYFLIRRYAGVDERKRSQDAFYASEEWRKGPREGIVSCIESYTSVVLELDQESIERLRKSWTREAAK